jgi:ubiquinone/menaquinone biosynthesis C-methylase UbiE
VTDVKDETIVLENAVSALEDNGGFAGSRGFEVSARVPIPKYLSQTYWWAYLHPAGIRVFERQWLVNLILWGNFARLRDCALAELGTTINGRLLQVACVYGDFTDRIAERLGPNGRLDVVDVAPGQLKNLTAKLKHTSQVSLHHQDSTNLAFADATFDNVVLFFLLHEQPEEARVRTVAEAARVVKPGGKLVFVDYHQPTKLNPFRQIMKPILRTLEPFAMDLWWKEIKDWMPQSVRPTSVTKETMFGGLYQKVVITV